MNQPPQDTLLEAYRRASKADAGRPAAATRNAILAEAAKVAQRAPAANASRYWPRMAAGIAVLGLGVLLWRQTDYRMPGDAPVVMAPMQAEAEVARERVPAPPPASEPAPASTRPPASAPTPVPTPQRGAARADRQVATAAAPAAPAPPEPAPQPAPPDPFPDTPRVAATEVPPPIPPAVLAPSTAAPSPAAPPPAAPAPPVVEGASPPLLSQNDAEKLELSEVQVTGTRRVPPASSGAPPPRAGAAARAGGPGGAGGAGGAGGGASRGGRASLPQVDRIALLRQYFPAQYQSEAPHSLWLVQSAAGEVLHSGELAPGQRLEDLAPQIADALGGRVPGPWQSETVRNARGQPIELAIAWLQ